MGGLWEGVVAGKRGLAALSGGLNRGLVGTVVDGAKRDLGEYDCGLVAPAGEDRKPWTLLVILGLGGVGMDMSEG